MCKQIFGKICQSLRQDLFDLSRGKPYSQNDLATATNLSIKVIGQIERGEKVNIDTDILDRLSNSFNLTSVERKRFYLLVNRDSSRQNEDGSRAFREAVAYMRSLKIPVLLHDGFYRILAISQAYFEVYGLTWEYLNDIPNNDLTKYHMVRHMHDPISPVKATFKTQMDTVGWHNASYWRFLSLAHRHTELFQQIQSTLLSKYTHFSYLWNGLNNPFPKNDMTSLIRPFAGDHPKFGRLEYSVISNQINDHRQELFLSTMVPHSERTLHLFSELTKSERAMLIDFSNDSAQQLEERHYQIGLNLPAYSKTPAELEAVEIGEMMADVSETPIEEAKTEDLSIHDAEVAKAKPIDLSTGTGTSFEVVAQVSGFPPFNLPTDQIEILKDLGDTLLVRHRFGETEVPKNPQRVFTDAATLPLALTFDLPVVASYTWGRMERTAGWEAKSANIVFGEWHSYAYNFEFILEQKPDLILAFSHIIYGKADQQAVYDKLSAIAPTIVLFNDPAELWPQATAELAQLFDLSTEQATTFENAGTAIAEACKPRQKFIGDETALLIGTSNVWMHGIGWTD
ncbi:MAG: hypothetical protein AAF633_10430, partial [Chloroflexota bacterium]